MKMKNILGCIVLVAICLSYYVRNGGDLNEIFREFPVSFGQRDGYGKDVGETLPGIDCEVGLPVAMPAGHTKLIHHTGYSVLYDETRHLPVWVAWTLTPGRFEEVVSRYDKFLPDPALEDPVTTDEFTRSGYDRGHMCPAADNKWDMQAMRESFYLTNICPQNHNLNSGDWKELEEACREWACENGKLYVVSGPVLYGTEQATIGYHKIAVPDAFYKVVLCPAPLKGIGFVCRNEAGNRPLDVYALSIDQVERITGIDFFSALPDSIENQVEAECSPADWGLGGKKKKKTV